MKNKIVNTKNKEVTWYCIIKPKTSSHLSPISQSVVTDRQTDPFFLDFLMKTQNRVKSIDNYDLKKY